MSFGYNYNFIFKILVVFILSYSSFNNIFADSFLEIDFTRAEPHEALSAGDGTVYIDNKNSFSLPLKNIDINKKIDFFVGNSLFRRNWVAAPSIKMSSDGLGPFFNGSSCESCHINDGRGHPPGTFINNNDDTTSIVLAIGIPPQNEFQNAQISSLRLKLIPDPTYGSQINDNSIEGILPEGSIKLEYQYFPILLDNGQLVTLRKPNYTIENLNYGPLHSEIRISARVAQPMIGLGLIEQIDISDVIANESKQNIHLSSISGKVSHVWDDRLNKKSYGLFGWKASQPSIINQTVDALHHDMGLSSSLYPNGNNCSEKQHKCKSMETGNSPNQNNVEVSDEQINLIIFYQKHLSVPARRNVDGLNILSGKKIFFESGCASCHVQKYKTKFNANDKSVSEQLIWPYSDFLLHDMGEGLADYLSEYTASGREWRTTPLWGIGLTETVNGHTALLHDGRARNILEAILWHGGESKSSRDKIIKLSIKEISQLVDFIESL